MNTITCLCLLLAVGSLNALSLTGFPAAVPAKLPFIDNVKAAVQATVPKVLDANVGVTGKLGDVLSGKVDASVLGLVDLNAYAKLRLKTECRNCVELTVVVRAILDADRHYVAKFYANALVSVKTAGKDCSLVKINADGKVAGVFEAHVQVHDILDAVVQLQANADKLDLSKIVADLQADITLNLGALLPRVVVLVVYSHELLNADILASLTLLLTAQAHIRLVVIGSVKLHLHLLAPILNLCVFVDSAEDLLRLDVDLLLGLCHRNKCNNDCREYVIVPSIDVTANAEVKIGSADLIAKVVAKINVGGNDCNKHFLYLNGQLHANLNVQDILQKLNSGAVLDILKDALSLNVLLDLNLNSVFKRRTFLITVYGDASIGPNFVQVLGRLRLLGDIILVGVELSVASRGLLAPLVNRLIVLGNIKAAIHVDFDRLLGMCPQEEAENPKAVPETPKTVPETPKTVPETPKTPADSPKDSLKILLAILVDRSGSVEDKIQCHKNFGKAVANEVNKRFTKARFIPLAFATNFLTLTENDVCESVPCTEAALDKIQNNGGTTHCELGQGNATVLLKKHSLPGDHLQVSLTITDAKCTDKDPAVAAFANSRGAGFPTLVAVLVKGPDGDYAAKLAGGINNLFLSKGISNYQKTAIEVADKLYEMALEKKQKMEG